jgi:hypothetical protein
MHAGGISVNVPALNVVAVNGVSGALPLFVDHASVANFNADGVQFHGSIVVDGRPVAMRSEMNHAAFVGGCYGALVMLAAAIVAYAAVQARKSWQLRAWLARQPQPDGAPNTRGFMMYEGSYRREGMRPPLDRLVPPSSAPALCPPRPAPTSIPGPGRIVRG